MTREPNFERLSNLDGGVPPNVYPFVLQSELDSFDPSNYDVIHSGNNGVPKSNAIDTIGLDYSADAYGLKSALERLRKFDEASDTPKEEGAQ
jgi:hypothetical protein